MRYVFSLTIISLFGFSCVSDPYPDYRRPRGRDYPDRGGDVITTDRDTPTRGGDVVVVDDPPTAGGRGIPYHLIEKCLAQIEPYRYGPKKLATFSTNRPPYAGREVGGISIIYHKPLARTDPRRGTYRRVPHSRLTFVDRSADLILVIRFIESQRHVLGVETTSHRGDPKTVANPERTAVHYLRIKQDDRHVSLKADQAARIIGKQVTELTAMDIAGVYAVSGPRGSQQTVVHTAATIGNLPRNSPIRQRVQRAVAEMKAYLIAQRMQIFRTQDNADFAFARGAHCPIAIGRVGLYSLRDFDRNGKPDLQADYRFGSGRVRPNTTLVMDSGRQLSVFRINGALQLIKGKWAVYNPSRRHPIPGRVPSMVVLTFANCAITVHWPRGIKPEDKWPVLQDVKWTANSVQTNTRPPRRR